MTTFYESRISTFEVDDSGDTLRDLTPYVISVDFPIDVELIDTTVLGDVGRTSIPGLENTIFTVEFQWSEDALVGPDTVIAPLKRQATTSSFEYGPEGNVTGDIMYTGECRLQQWRPGSRVGEQVKGTATFRVSGAVTRAAHG